MSVKARVLVQTSGEICDSDWAAAVHAQGNGALLGTATITASCEQKWSNYVFLSAPSGGWTGAQVQALGVSISVTPNVQGTTNDVFRVEIRVQATSTTPQTEVDYLYSDGTDVFYNRLLMGGTSAVPGTQDEIDTTTGNIYDNFSAVSNGTDTVHLIFVDAEATDQVSYKQWTDGGGWTTPTLSDSLVTGGADNNDAYVSLSLDTTNGVLYALWIDTSTSYIYYSFCTVSSGCDTAAKWAAESSQQETLWKSEGTNTNITSNYSGAARIFAGWTQGDVSPYTVNWDIITAVPENLWMFFMAGPIIPFLLKRKRKREAAIILRV
jgi:hypothetical protein